MTKFFLDFSFIALTAGGGVACWLFELPLWMLVFCVVLLAFAIISLLGDLGLFGRFDKDDS